MSYFLLFLFSFIGFFTNRLLTKPESRINRRLPKIQFKSIQFSPSIEVYFRKRIFHLHHWMSYSILLIITITFVSGGLFDLVYIKGFFFGGIVQGFTFPDWKKIFYLQEK